MTFGVWGLSFKLRHYRAECTVATMISEVYDALIDAGASEKSRRAAETLADYDDRFNRLERKLDGAGLAKRTESGAARQRCHSDRAER